MLNILKKYNEIGIVSSTLCFVHCVFTPFLIFFNIFNDIEIIPVWFKLLDFLFILIGLFAILTSFKYNSNIKLSFALIINWVFILLIVINEKIELFHFPEILILIPSATIILLHLYIRNNFCQCKNQTKKS
ncbi:MAG: hypothetical protein CMD07_02215 [Flavobacteriales bacterium]|nr:hypothetical protein [Flavobacteriales bacterium]